jgi:hypothetical protein
VDVSLGVFQGDEAPLTPVAVSDRAIDLFVAQERGGLRISLVSLPDVSPLRASLAEVFINEGGRRIMIRDAAEQPAAAAVPRNTRTALATTDRWQVIPASGNVSRDHLAADVGARFEPQQAGPECRLTLSRCGRDTFIVVRFVRIPALAETVLGDTGLQFLVVRVMKRLRFHNVEMRRPGGAGNYSMPGTIESARRHLRDEFGIVLEQTGPTHTVNNQEPLIGTPAGANNALEQYLEAHAGLPANVANRPPRELWIVASGRLRHMAGGADLAGLAIAPAIAAVSLRSIADELVADRQTQADFDAFRQLPNRIDGSPEGYVFDQDRLRRQQGLPPLTPQQRQAILTVLTVGPDEIALRSARATLLHEIGHVFGLVPDTEIAGGVVQPNWMDRDAQHPAGHCGDNSCLMWWEAELAATGSSWLRSHAAGPGFQGDARQDCSLYLRAVDLADLKNVQ